MIYSDLFSRANKLLRDKRYLDSVVEYKRLISKNPFFSCYSENAAYASDKGGAFVDSASLYLQSYLIATGNRNGLLAASSLKERNCSDDLVLVIIPAFNAEKTIFDSVRSVLSQEHENLKIVVVDDASTDRTYEILLDLQSEDGRLHVIKNVNNRGALFSVNLGLFLFRWFDFNYFIKHDADDLMVCDKLKVQVDALKKNKSAYFCTAGYTRIDFNSKNVISGKSFGHNMTLYKSDVFRKIGYFDVNLFGSDSEYLERALAAYGNDARIHIDKRLTHAYSMDAGIVKNNPLGSADRVAYQGKFRLEHAMMSDSHFFFRSFEIHDELIKGLRGKSPVVCGVATLYDRRDALRDVVLSILPQVDKLFVYQNDYKEIFDFLRNEKIEVISALDTGIDMGDAGKFYRLKDFYDANYFSIDDDLIYPPNYVDTLLDILARYDGRVIVSAHGRVSTSRISSYYKDKIRVFHFGNEVERLSEVHFGGTGVMVFNTKTVGLDFDYFTCQNMADVWVGLYARENNIPILIPPHSSNWICHSEKFDVETTIFRASKKEDSKHAKTVETVNCLVSQEDFSEINTVDAGSGKINKAIVIAPNKGDYFISRHRSITVAIPTFNRAGLLIRLVEQLDVAAKYFNVRVIIFDDGSESPVGRELFNLNNIVEIETWRYPNHGKKRYWSLVNKILERLSTIRSDYYFYLGDDLEVGPRFFFDALYQWESIDDENKISLNLLRDARTKSWTNFDRVEKDFSGFSVFQTQWLDMIMLFDYKILSHRLDEIPLSRWENKPLLSSGVGAQLSSRFHSMGYGMYQVISSLVYHGDHESEMNPEERKLNPLIAS